MLRRWLRSALHPCCTGTATIATCRTACDTAGVDAALSGAGFQRTPTQLALQFHLETEPARLETWLVGHTVELGKAGIDPRELRDQARKLGPATARSSDESACGMARHGRRRRRMSFPDIGRRSEIDGCRLCVAGCWQPAARRADLVSRRRPGASFVHAGGRSRSRYLLAEPSRRDRRRPSSASAPISSCATAAFRAW